jgi:hypothetical protein
MWWLLTLPSASRSLIGTRQIHVAKVVVVVIQSYQTPNQTEIALGAPLGEELNEGEDDGEVVRR